jgi:hypothetical protein
MTQQDTAILVRHKLEQARLALEDAPQAGSDHALSQVRLSGLWFPSQVGVLFVFGIALSSFTLVSSHSSLGRT